MILHRMGVSARRRGWSPTDPDVGRLANLFGFKEEDFARPIWPLGAAAQWVGKVRGTNLLAAVFAELVTVFEAGAVSVAGCTHRLDAPEEIPAIDWGNLGLWLDCHLEPEAKRKAYCSPAWVNMRVRRDEMLEAFPAPEAVSPGVVAKEIMREFLASAEGTGEEVEQRDEPAQSSRSLTSRRGAKPKFDWPEYEREYAARVDADGAPDLQNVEGWQIQADVARWLQGLAKRDGQEMSPDAAKRKARELMVLKGA